MTTLTQVSITARRVIRWGIYGIVILIVGRIVISVGMQLYRNANPPPPAAPTVNFGRLPMIEFPEQSDMKFSYTLQTPSGELPVFAGQAKVYFMSRPSVNFFSYDKAQKRAQGLGFTGAEQQIAETLYRFQHPTAPSRIEMSTVTGFFSLNYDLTADQAPLTQRPQSVEVAATDVRSFLSGAGLLEGELAEGRSVEELLKFENGNLVRALSLSDADVIKISLYRKDYDELPVYSINPSQSSVWFIVSGVRERGMKFVAGEYKFLPVNEESWETYPIKTAQQAWDEFSTGVGYVANGGDNAAGENIVIRRVYLAYLDPEQKGQFLQPVVVYEGDGGFVGYIPAISSEYYGR